MQRRTQATRVHFTGVPLFADKNDIRQHFESVGHTVDFRLFNSAPGKDFRWGLVEYMDDKTAEEAITRLNGTMFGERPMKVTPAVQMRNHYHNNLNNFHRKRRREVPPHYNNFSDGPAGSGKPRTTMTFARGYTDPILGREDSVVLDCMRGVETSDAYEAVEQLRVLALERRHDAKQLLAENPALRSAVLIVLQHAGRLPTGSLPAEAFQSYAGTQESRAQSQQESTEPSSTQASQQTTEAQRDEVLQLISNMSEADVESILTMSDASLAAVPDAAQRRQLEVLRNRLLEMSSDL